MSFDIFLQCFRNGEPEPISRELFESIFLPHAMHPDAYKKDPSYLTVEYPDNSRAEIYTGYAKEDRTHSSNFMFNHCGGPSFWADLYQLADRSKSIIYWPSENSMYVYTEGSVPQGVPEGAFDSGVQVRSGIDIVAAIEAS